MQLGLVKELSTYFLLCINQQCQDLILKKKSVINQIKFVVQSSNFSAPSIPNKFVVWQNVFQLLELQLVAQRPQNYDTRRAVIFLAIFLQLNFIQGGLFLLMMMMRRTQTKSLTLTINVFCFIVLQVNFLFQRECNAMFLN
eukprot:TRINITY_DN6685_c0_g1_i2.p3 TRINITY_DN6685_c0_g1~~TRINITY_DN6685_c0_g1_i2.p3  ORF type:complete len:141 (-),score=3.25 TRINITY_DN6685_c0_g1_i2:428-850(-)